MENVTGLKRYTEDMDCTLSTKLKLCYNQFMENEIYVGSVYKHYKGNKYVVVSIAVHTETLEELVIYRAIYGDGELWARPKKMFLDNIEKDGKIIPRFKLIKKL